MFEVSLSVEEFSVAGSSPFMRGTSTIISWNTIPGKHHISCKCNYNYNNKY